MKTTQVMLATGFGGAERSFVDMVLSLAQAGHEVQAICEERFGHRHLLEGVPGVAVRTLRVRGEWDVFARRSLRALLREFGPEVVHTQLRRAAAIAGGAAKTLGIPVVAKLHNYVDLRPYRDVTVLVATTEDEKRHALELGWPAERLVVIPNFTRVPPVETVRAAGTEGACSLLSYGRLVEKKGFDLLLRAVAKVRAEGVAVNLRIGGEGPCRSDLDALRSELELGDGIEVGTWIDDVQAALDSADIFVLPSRDEPFGIVILEAMARGVPIVTTRTQGPSEILTEKSGFLAHVNDVDSLAEAIALAVRSPDERVARAREALTLFKENYSAAAVIPRIVELYGTLISSP